MTDSKIIASGAQGVVDNTPEYFTISGSLAISSTTEGGNREECIFTQAGVLKNGTVYVSANSVSNACPIRLRKKTTTDANPVISVTADTTGIFQDTTNTQTVSANDEYYWIVNPPTEAGTNTITIQNLGLTFTPDTTTNTVSYFVNGLSTNSVTTNGTTVWRIIDGSQSTQTTETNSYARARCAFTWQNLSALTVTYAKGGASTIKSDIDGTVGNQTISITAAGRTTDTTHTDSITAGNDINYEITYFADANGWTVSNITSEGISTGSSQQNVANVDSNVAITTVQYWPLQGENLGTTENNTKIATKLTATWKELAVNVSANGITATSTIASRIDTTSGTGVGSSSSGTQLVSYGSGVTGIVVDSTHTDSIASDNKLNYMITPGGTGTNITVRNSTSVFVQAVNYTKTFTIDVTLLKNLTKTFTADVTLKKNLTKTFTVDATLLKNYTKTFTADVTLLKNYTKTFTIDTVLKKLDIPKTFTVDTILKKLDNLKTFTIDTVLATSGTKTFTIDAVLKKNLTKTLTVDTVLQKLGNLKTFTVDSILNKNFTKSFTIDTVLQKGFSKALTIDTVLLKNFTKTFTVDTILLKNYTKSFTIDSVLKKNLTKTFTVDTVLISEGAVTYTKSFTIDAVLQRLSTRRIGSAIRRKGRKLPPKTYEIIPIELHIPLESAVTIPLKERLPLRSFVYQNLRTIIKVESSIFSRIIESLALRSTVSEETNTHTILESYISNGPTVTSLLIESDIKRDKMDKIRSKLIDLIGEEYETS